MAIDLKALDRKIAKLQRLKELASDPEMLELLKDLTGSNGGGERAATIATSKAEKTPTENAELQLTGDLASTRRGSLKRNVWRFIPESEATPLTARTIADSMSGAGYEFRAKDPKLAVLEVVKGYHAAGMVEKCGETSEGAYLWKKKHQE